VPKVPPYPVEFRQRAVELARLREKPVAELASDLGVSETSQRNWAAQADRDEGRRSDGLTSAEREELVRLRRERSLSHSPTTSQPTAREAACPALSLVKIS
jgi:transposase-like protein